jgi:amino acid transporter
LNVSFALASQSCFLNGERIAALSVTADWTRLSMIALMIIACVIALLSALVSWHAYRRTDDKSGGDVHHVLDMAGGRSRFLALWGVALGAGFALATALTAIAFLVPRCAG